MTLSTRPQTPMSVIGRRSLAKPGSMPVVKHDVPPSVHACSIGSSIHRSAVGHQTKFVIDVDTTSLPARSALAMFSMLSRACSAVGP